MITTQWYSTFENGINVLYNTHDTGLYSSTLSSYGAVIYHINEQNYISKIDFSNSHTFFKNEKDFDLYPFLYKKNENFDKIMFDHPVEWDDLIGNDLYRDLNYNDLNLITDFYYSPSNNVIEKINFFKEKYNIDVNNTIGILYRGTDRTYENQNPEKYIELCNTILSSNPEMSVLIQSDQQQFIDECLKNITTKNTIVIEELPKTVTNTVIHHLHISNRLEWTLNLDSVIRILSECKILINHNGSVSFMSCLYRGNSKNMYMFNKKSELIEPYN